MNIISIISVLFISLQALLAMLHVVEPGEEDANDPIQKITPLLDHFKNSCKQLYNADCQVRLRNYKISIRKSYFIESLYKDYERINHTLTSSARVLKSLSKIILNVFLNRSS